MEDVVVVTRDDDGKVVRKVTGDKVLDRLKILAPAG